MHLHKFGLGSWVSKWDGNNSSSWVSVSVLVPVCFLLLDEYVSIKVMQFHRLDGSRARTQSNVVPLAQIRTTGRGEGAAACCSGSGFAEDGFSGISARQIWLQPREGKEMAGYMKAFLHKCPSVSKIVPFSFASRRRRQRPLQCAPFGLAVRPSSHAFSHSNPINRMAGALLTSHIAAIK
jgi:hypothetical protein